MAKKLKERKISIVPGKKICPSCGKDINETLINEHEEALPHSDEELLDFEANLDGDRNREILNSSLIEEDISPLKLHAVASHSRVAHGKRKIAQVQSRFRQKQLDLQITMAKAIDVEPRELDLREFEEDSYNSDTMMCEAETDKDSEQVTTQRQDDNQVRSLGKKKCCNPLEKEANRKGHASECTLEVQNKLKRVNTYQLFQARKFVPAASKDINEHLIELRHVRSSPHSDESIDFEQQI
eukprot:gene1183-15545_t